MTCVRGGELFQLLATRMCARTGNTQPRGVIVVGLQGSPLCIAIQRGEGQGKIKPVATLGSDQKGLRLNDREGEHP